MKSSGQAAEFAARYLDLGKPTARGAKAALEGIVTGGIQDHDVEARLGLDHMPQHESRVYRLELDIGLASEVGTYWDQVVPTVHLEAMASVVEESDTAPALQAGTKPTYRLVEGLLGHLVT